MSNRIGYGLVVTLLLVPFAPAAVALDGGGQCGVGGGGLLDLSPGLNPPSNTPFAFECTTQVLCPTHSASPCRFMVSVSIQGDGIVSAQGTSAGSCSELFSCEAGNIVEVAASTSLTETCRVGAPTAALNVHLTCTIALLS